MQDIHNDNKKRSGQKRGRGHCHNEFDDSDKNSEEENYHNEFDDSDDEGETRNTKKRKFISPAISQHHDAISDSPNSESTKTPPPLPPSKPSKGEEGPDTPSPPTDKPVKYSESTPNSTPLSNQRGEPAVTGQEGVKRCLFDLIETEGEKYIRKLRKAATLSESEIKSAEELAKRGAKLSEHGETIQKLGKRLISISKDRFDEYLKSLAQPSSPDP